MCPLWSITGKHWYQQHWYQQQNPSWTQLESAREAQCEARGDVTIQNDIY